MDNKETIKDFIIKLPTNVHKAVKSICALRNITMKQFFLEAALAKIQEHESFQ